MKQKHTRAKKANRINHWASYQSYIYSLSVFWRRVRGITGSDSRTFDIKHPSLDGAVEGMKARIAQATAGMHRKVL